MNWAIVPYIDNAAMTRQAVADLLAQTLPTKVLLIDNGSGAEGRQAGLDLTGAHPDRVWLWQHTPPFPSLSAAWNLALDFVWEAGGSYAFVVNNDVRLAPLTYEALLSVAHTVGAWFVTGVGVTAEQFKYDLSRQQVLEAIGGPIYQTAYTVPPEKRGGPDFSCFVIARDCHRWFRFDEGFQPAYHEDNDYHRRLQLAGFDGKIFGVNLPFHHIGSATVNRSPQAREAFHARFAACQQYYIQKWGGLPQHETYSYPFNMNPAQTLGIPDLDVEGTPLVYTGQGRPGYTYQPVLGERYPWAV